jgi:hypothetical protein
LTRARYLNRFIASTSKTKYRTTILFQDVTASPTASHRRQGLARS